MKVESRKLECYKALMAKKDQLLGAMISSETLSEILKMCDKEERSKSWIAAAMIERGLAAYKRDGLLKEPSGLKLPLITIREKDKQGRRKTG